MKKNLYIFAATALAGTVAAATALAGGFQSTHTSTKTSSAGGRESRTSDSSVGSSGAHKLRVEIPVGLVHLSTVRGGDLRVHAVRSCRGPLDADARHWLEDSVLTVQRVGSDLVVKDTPFGKKGRHEMRGNFDPKLDVTLTVPEGIDVDLEVSAGNVDGGGRYGSFQGRVSAGTLKLKSLACAGPFDLTAEAGEVVALLTAPPTHDSKVRAGAGQVVVDLPKGSNVDITASAGIGQVSGLPASSAKKDGPQTGDYRRARIGRGGVKLELETGTGNIQLGAKGAAASEEEDIDLSVDGAIDKDDIQVEVDSSDGDQLSPADRKKIHQEVEKALKEAQAEVKRAMEEVRRELKASKMEMKDLDLRGDFFNDKEFSKSIEEIVRAALETARKATDEALKAVDKANAKRKG